MLFRSVRLADLSGATKQDILELAEAHHVRFLRLMFTDILGVNKNVEIPSSQFRKALDGDIMFDGSSIEGLVSGWQTMVVTPPAAAARIFATATGAELRLEEPQHGISPGQAGVIYRGDRVLGGGWIADYVDPHVFLEIWASKNLNNDTGFANAQYDALLEQALRAPDQKARYDIYQKMDALLVEELPVLPIYYYTSVKALSPRVKGYSPTLLDSHPYKYLWLEAGGK